MWGSCFWFCIPSASSSCSARALSHTHTTLSQLCHTHTHTRNIFHTQLCHTPSLAHNFVSHNLVTHSLSHTHTRNFVTHTQLCHTTLSHRTLSYTHSQSFTHSNAQLCHRQSWRHPPSFCVAGVALGDIYLRFAWQAWHFTTSTFVLRGRRGTYGTGLALAARLGAAWAPLVAGDAAALCVAGVALGETHLRFAWQAWHLGTSTFVLRGRRGTYSAGLGWLWWRAWARLVAGDATALCVAGVALGDIHLPLRGRGGTWRHPPSFAWQGWHLATSTFVFAGQAWDLATSTLRLRGRAALVALSHTHNFVTHNFVLRLAWHAGVAPALTLSHTHNSFIHTNFNTQLFHMQICHTHTSLSRTNLKTHTHTSTHNSSTHNLLHTILSHTAVHTKLFYTQLLHTLPFTRDSFTHNIVTHTQPFLVTHTHHSFTHSSITYSSFTQPVFRHLISFPIPFSHLF